jgi:cytochrome c biogenesis factor
MSPLSLEQPEIASPGSITLAKGESQVVDKYTITFHDFALSSHGESGVTEAEALLTVTYDDTEESLRPALRAQEKNLSVVPAVFDNEQGAISIAAVRPDDGAVMLQVTGPFLPETASNQASLVIELAEKPLINLFWLGTILLFASGLLSMRERRRRTRAASPSLRVKKSGEVTPASEQHTA